MTTLDKQALEKAIDSWNTQRMSIAERVETVVRDYLAALPEARRAWGVMRDGALISPLFADEYSALCWRGTTIFDEKIAEFEAREVRQP